MGQLPLVVPVRLLSQLHQKNLGKLLESGKIHGDMNIAFKTTLGQYRDSTYSCRVHNVHSGRQYGDGAPVTGS